MFDPLWARPRIVDEYGTDTVTVNNNDDTPSPITKLGAAQ